MIQAIFEPLRIYQWYKNLVIFVPLIFARHLFNLDELILTLFGFIYLCLLSSANYIFNDLVDLKADKIHPEKKKRAIASGRINKKSAFFIALILTILSLYLGYKMSRAFFFILISLFCLTQAYSLGLKKKFFLDILIIAINFILRTVSGVVIINVPLSFWLYLCLFFLALFLAVNKRFGETLFFNEKEKKLIDISKLYSIQLLKFMRIIFIALLFLSWGLYSFLNQPNLILTIPIVLYGLLRYLFVINKKSEIARYPENIIRDWKFDLSIILWIILVILLLYTS